MDFWQRHKLDILLVLVGVFGTISLVLGFVAKVTRP